VSDYNKDFYEPAIHGTRGLLEEALKEKSVKRVVITSSFAAIIHPEK
jgi:nucleoside-diphosphate-sugar epimerase